MILYGKDVDVMKRKIYRIKLWIDKINFCKWEVYAKDNMEMSYYMILSMIH